MEIEKHSVCLKKIFIIKYVEVRLNFRHVVDLLV